MFSRCSIFLPHGIGCAGPAGHLSKGVRRLVFRGCRSDSLPHKISFLSRPSSSRFLCSAGTGLCLTVTLRNCTGVETRALNQAVKRNRERFPENFMFQLTLEEGNAVRAVRSQNVTLKRGEHLK